MTEADPLEVAAWQMAVGRLASEDLPEIATDALVRGLDSPALHPEAAEQIEAAIVAAAQELLDRAAPRRWIKLMAVRGRSPLTQTTGPDNVEVDPGALPLSDGLRSDLARWSACFEATLSGWPAAGGFDAERDAERFVAAGRELILQLQDELGASYHVEYMPEPIRPPGVKLRAQ